MCYSDNLQEIASNISEEGQRAVDSAARQLGGQALEDLRRVIETYVGAAIIGQESRFSNHQWSACLLKEEAEMREKLVSCTQQSELLFISFSFAFQNLLLSNLLLLHFLSYTSLFQRDIALTSKKPVVTGLLKPLSFPF